MLIGATYKSFIHKKTKYCSGCATITPASRNGAQRPAMHSAGSRCPLISSDLSIVRSRKALSLCDEIGFEHTVKRLGKCLVVVLADAELVELEVVHALSDDSSSAPGGGRGQVGGELGKVAVGLKNVVPLCGAAMAVSE